MIDRNGRNQAEMLKDAPVERLRYARSQPIVDISMAGRRRMEQL